VEWVGIPVDAKLLCQLNASWEPIKAGLIAAVRLPSGALDLSRDTFGQPANTYPLVQPLHELRTTFSDVRLNDMLSARMDGTERSCHPLGPRPHGTNQATPNSYLSRPDGCGAHKAHHPVTASVGTGNCINGYISGDPYGLREIRRAGPS
jgi:hypothetical protein